MDNQYLYAACPECGQTTKITVEEFEAYHMDIVCENLLWDPDIEEDAPCDTELTRDYILSSNLAAACHKLGESGLPPYDV